MNLFSVQQNNERYIDINNTTKKTFLKAYFSHRTSNSYSLFNEIRVLKPKEKINFINQSSFLKMNTKRQSIERGVCSPVASIEKRIKTKHIYSSEVNSNDDQIKSELQAYHKKVAQRNKQVSIAREQKKGENELRLLYNSIDIRKDDLKKYWTNQKKNSNSMNFVQIKQKEKEIHHRTNRLLKGNCHSLAPSSINLFRKIDYNDKKKQKDKDRDKDKDIDWDREKEKEKEKDKKIVNQNGNAFYKKLFIRIQNQRNCISHSKKKSVQNSLNSNILNLSLVNKDKDKEKTRRKRNNCNLITKSKKTQSNQANTLNGSDGLIHFSHHNIVDIILESEGNNKNEDDVNINSNVTKVINIDEPNDLISLDDEDEKLLPLCHLPIFASKKLSYYYSSHSESIEKKISKCFSISNIFNALLQYLNSNDFTALSLTNTSLEKRTRDLRYNRVISLIIGQSGIRITQATNSIWNHLKLYSQLSQATYLKKTYLDNAFKHSKYLLDIKKDIIRTYPKDSSFNESSQSYKQLLSVLNAYANYNPNIGYAQGMNFILAKILLRSKSEEEALMYLDAIMSRLHMETIFGISNQLAITMNNIGELISKALPSFDIFLKDHSLSHEVFTANWVITLFSSSVDNEELFAIWDFVFIFGWKFVHCFIIAIINTFQREIINLKFDNYSEEIKKILHSKRFKQQFRNIVELAFDYISKYDSFKE